MDIIIKKSETKALAKMLTSCSSDFDDELKKFLSAIDKISDAWTGHQGITDQLNLLKGSYYDELEKLNETIKKVSEYLSNVPESYSILDENFSSKSIQV